MTVLIYIIVCLVSEPGLCSFVPAYPIVVGCYPRPVDIIISTTITIIIIINARLLAPRLPRAATASTANIASIAFVIIATIAR